MSTTTVKTVPASLPAAARAKPVVGEVNFRKFVSSSSAAFAIRVAAAGFSFVMNVVVTRVLGAHEAGLFFLGQTFLLILAVSARFGLDNVLVKFVSTSKDQGNLAAANGVLFKAACVTAPLALAIAGLTYAFSDWIAGTLLNQAEFAVVLRGVAICVIPFACFQLFSFALQGSKRFVWSMLISATVFPLALLIAAGFPSIFGVDSASSLMNIAIGVSLATALLAIIVWFTTTGISVDRKSVRWGSVFSVAFPLFCITVVSYANTWAPQLVLAANAEADQIAILSVSMKTAALIALLILPINSVASPTFAAMYERKEHQGLQTFVRKVNGIILLASVPMLLTLFIFAPQILSIFGPQFAEAKWVLRILVLGQMVNAISGSVSFLLMMTSNERYLRNVTAVSAVAGLILSFVLIPRFGAIGAAVAGTLSLLIYNGLVWLIVRWRLGVNVFQPDFGFALKYLRRYGNG